MLKDKTVELEKETELLKNKPAEGVSPWVLGAAAAGGIILGALVMGAIKQ